MATTEFTRAQTAGTSTKKLTVSTWLKRGSDFGTNNAFFSCGTGASDGFNIGFTSNNYLILEAYDGSANPKLETNRKFRDPGAWYHIVAVWDTDAAATDRMRFYVNGVEETSFAQDTNPTSSYVIPGWSGSGDTMRIGQTTLSGWGYFDGDMAHVHVCDGQAYAASDFGETDSTSGIWVAKTTPSVTYGINGGFYKFVSGALTTDSSGESNTLTSVGTPTTTKDTPDNNFCTWNPLTQNGGTYSNGNTSRTAGDDTGGTLGVTKGKWYWEYKRTNTSNSIHYGICSTSNGFNNAGQQMLNGGTDAVGASLWLSEGGTGTDAYGNAGGFSSVSYSVPSVSISNGDIIGVALDISTSSGTVEWFENGVSLGTASFTYDDSVPVYPFIRLNTSVTTDTNFGNGYFGTTVISSAGTSSSGDDSIWEYDCPADHYGLNANNIATYG